MWDEDPRWVQAQYMFVVCGVAVLGVVVLFASALTRNWTMAAWYFGGLGIILGGLCTYAAIVCSICWGVVLLARIWRWLFHSHTDG